MDDAVWVPTVFTKNRERLIEHTPSSRLGPVTKALCAKTAASMVATAATSKAKAAAVIRTSPAPTPMLGCTAKATTPADCAKWATPSPTIVMG